MTEYDFSEEAYKRHFETQARISKWTQSTQRLPQADPFTPPTPVNVKGHAPLPSESKHHRSRSSDPDKKSRRDSSRRRRSPPPPLPLERSRSSGPRPRTAPPRGDVYGVQQPAPQPYYPAPGQPHYAPQYFSAPPVPQPQSHNRSRSSSQVPPPPPKPTRSRSYSVTQLPQMPPVRANSYPYVQGQKGYVYHAAPGYAPGYGSAPPPRPGYGSSPHLAQPVPQQQQPIYVRPGTFMVQPQPVVASPTREVPLLKRVFGFGGKNREGSRSRV
ncbi:hypothetical protein C8F04DRAFT_1194709 [Mycena alexandri]|uniref:Uncharacterized protein n=1 Tax=Mycena alexandri TaxID=1745969 RepID=A0AAD6S6R1_9AGAR|nr:hypothetical protein C8F04DRAFT_1194709 [Mycena alexandri]